MKQDPFALCPARVEMRVGLNMDNIALLQDKCKEHCFTIKTISDNSYCIQNQKENKVFCCNFLYWLDAVGANLVAWMTTSS